MKGLMLHVRNRECEYMLDFCRFALCGAGAKEPRMTTLRTLECLVALVDHGSVSAAAAALHMSQPALSHQIAALEKELGAPVVERLWRGVRVTAAGRASAEEARQALRAADQAIQIGRQVGEGSAGRLR